MQWMVVQVTELRVYSNLSWGQLRDVCLQSEREKKVTNIEKRMENVAVQNGYSSLHFHQKYMKLPLIQCGWGQMDTSDRWNMGRSARSFICHCKAHSSIPNPYHPYSAQRSLLFPLAWWSIVFNWLCLISLGFWV